MTDATPTMLEKLVTDLHKQCVKRRHLRGAHATLRVDCRARGTPAQFWCVNCKAAAALVNQARTIGDQHTAMEQAKAAFALLRTNQEQVLSQLHMLAGIALEIFEEIAGADTLDAEQQALVAMLRQYAAKVPPPVVPA